MCHLEAAEEIIHIQNYMECQSLSQRTINEFTYSFIFFFGIKQCQHFKRSNFRHRYSTESDRQLINAFFFLKITILTCIYAAEFTNKIDQ